MAKTKYLKGKLIVHRSFKLQINKGYRYLTWAFQLGSYADIPLLTLAASSPLVY